MTFVPFGHLVGPPELIILDFDGVVADSELLANTYLADFLTTQGLPTTAEQSIARYMGRRWADTEASVAQALGRALPTDFQDRYRSFVDGRVRSNVQAVPGIVDFLARNHIHRFCVASSSTPDWLAHGVAKFGIGHALDDRLFSATAVANGKPAPDIFLHAAAQMGVPPQRCAVLEDSTAGVQGAVAAGMTVLGFLGGAHIRAEHAPMLRAAGAHGLAQTFGEVEVHLGLQASAA
jgi:HAD superfamily hydrolase (TIGR01509 family)